MLLYMEWAKAGLQSRVGETRLILAISVLIFALFFITVHLRGETAKHPSSCRSLPGL